jgi:hypothetical protein
MTTLQALPRDAEAEVRWREWQARGEKADERRAAIMAALMGIVSIGLAVGLLVQLI